MQFNQGIDLIRELTMRHILASNPNSLYLAYIESRHLFFNRQHTRKVRIWSCNQRVRMMKIIHRMYSEYILKFIEYIQNYVKNKQFFKKQTSRDIFKIYLQNKKNIIS